MCPYGIMVSTESLIQTFVLSGATVAGITYVANSINPLAAGIVSGVPVSIPSMLLVKGRSNQKEFIWSAFIMVCFLALVTGFCAYLMYETTLSDVQSVLVSFVSWCVGAFMYYMYIHGK